MFAFPFFKADTARILLRVVVGLMLSAHGWMRISIWGMYDFGDWLDSQGFVIGDGIAWFLTLFEIVGGTLMAFGVAVRYIALIFIIEITMGIILVHSQHGWFVVGHTLNGVEYSVLLVITLFVIAASDPIRNRKNINDPH